MRILSSILFLFAIVTCEAATLQKGDAFPAIQGISTGYVTLVDFWASWCAPCKASFPAMDRIHDAFKNRRFKLVAISVDEDTDAMHRFLEEHPVHFTILHDEEQKLVSKLDIPAMPTSFLLDKNGRVASVHEGFRMQETEEELMQEIQILLRVGK